jgi:hypothetical protein
MLIAIKAARKKGKDNEGDSERGLQNLEDDQLSKESAFPADFEILNDVQIKLHQIDGCV